MDEAHRTGVGLQPGVQGVLKEARHQVHIGRHGRQGFQGEMARFIGAGFAATPGLWKALEGIEPGEPPHGKGQGQGPQGDALEHPELQRQTVGRRQVERGFQLRQPVNHQRKMLERLDSDGRAIVNPVQGGAKTPCHGAKAFIMEFSVSPSR